MTIIHKFKKYTFFAANMRMMCGEIEYTVYNYEKTVSDAMRAASLEPHTKTACEKCWTPEEIKQINKAKERFPQNGYKPKPELKTGRFYDVISHYPPKAYTFMVMCPICALISNTAFENAEHIDKEHRTKENTMNKYHVFANPDAFDEIIEGTRICTTFDGTLRIFNGENIVAEFRRWEHYSVEQNADKGYVEKIENLERTVKYNRAVVKELEKAVSVAEQFAVQDNTENERLTKQIAIRTAERDALNEVAAKLRREKSVIELSQRNTIKEIQKLRRENTEYKRENYMLKDCIKSMNDVGTLTGKCHSVFKEGRAPFDVDHECRLPAGHQGAHRDGICSLTW